MGDVSLILLDHTQTPPHSPKDTNRAPSCAWTINNPH